MNGGPKGGHDDWVALVVGRGLRMNGHFAPEAVVVRATRSRRRDLTFSHAITISRPFRPSRFFMAIFVCCEHYHPCLLLRQRSLNVRQTGSARARCLADASRLIPRSSSN